jgi:mannose-6-phosphate isomerase-like protein (cupin superfamily)
MERPWGTFDVLSGNDLTGYKVKKITVLPNKRLSLQSHNQRKEHWFCVSGSGQAQIDHDFIPLVPGKQVFIDIQQKHRLINNSDSNLEIIEIQFGDYLGEDDIIRYEDDFSRV